jgi:hypothetical protein
MTCWYYGISRQVFYTWHRRYETEGLAGLRARADSGDWDAAAQLALLLVQWEDVDELRDRADAGNVAVTRQLARLLADQGAVGFGNARQVAELLTQQDRGGEGKRVRRFGLNPDGSIACS